MRRVHRAGRGVGGGGWAREREGEGGVWVVVWTARRGELGLTLTRTQSSLPRPHHTPDGHDHQSNMGRSTQSSRSATLTASTSHHNPFLGSSASAAGARGGSVNNKPTKTPTKARDGSHASPRKAQRAYEDALEQVAEDEAGSLARLELLLESFELEGQSRARPASHRAPLRLPRAQLTQPHPPRLQPPRE